MKVFPGGSEGKESACKAGDLGSIPGFRRFPGEENGNPLQYSCLENPTDRGVWQATVCGIEKSQTLLSDSHTHTHTHTRAHTHTHTQTHTQETKNYHHYQDGGHFHHLQKIPHDSLLSPSAAKSRQSLI